MTVLYETKFDKSGDVRDVGHIRVLKASGTSCCSGDNPEHFCESCKAEIDTDFAKLKANEVRPVIHYFIPSTGEMIRRPERTPRTTPKPAPPKKPMTASERLLAKAKPMPKPAPSNAAPPPPSILDVVRRKAKSLLSNAKVNDSGIPDAPSLMEALRLRKTKTTTNGVPEPKSLVDILRSKK